MVVFVFGKLFFLVGIDLLMGIIVVFGGFMVGFIVWLIGGVLCGYIGDWYGCKVVMIFMLFMMGMVIVLMGVLLMYW